MISQDNLSSQAISFICGKDYIYIIIILLLIRLFGYQFFLQISGTVVLLQFNSISGWFRKFFCVSGEAATPSNNYLICLHSQTHNIHR